MMDLLYRLYAEAVLGVRTATDDADVIFWNTPEAEKVRDLVRSLQT